MIKSVVASAPGKAILHGEYAVVFGKSAIAASVQLRTTVKINSLETQDAIKIVLNSFNKEFCWPLTKLQNVTIPGNPTGNVIEQSPDIGLILDGLIEGDASLSEKESAKAFLFLLFGIKQTYKIPKLEAMEVTVSSEFPVGAGLGSSAAFSVSLAGGLFKALGLLNIEKQHISDWAFQCERIFHGKPSGIDNSICTFGGALLYKEGKIIDQISELTDLPVLMVYTNVSRNTKALVESAKMRRELFPDVISGTFNAIESISATAWKSFNEERLDKTQYNMMVDMNQHLLNVLGAGHEKIDDIVKLAKRHNCSAKLTGAGGGGCVLVHLNSNSNNIEDLKLELEKNNFKVWSVSLGSGGLSVN